MGVKLIIKDADFLENAIDGRKTARIIQGYIVSNSGSSVYCRIQCLLNNPQLPNVPKAILTCIRIPNGSTCKISVISKNTDSIVEGLYCAFVASPTEIELVHESTAPNPVANYHPLAQGKTGSDGVITINNNEGQDLYYYVYFANNEFTNATEMPVSNYRVEYEIE